MVEVEGSTEKFLSTLMQVCVALGSAIKNCVWKTYPSDYGDGCPFIQKMEMSG